MLAFILLVVGGLNWLAVGALDMNLVDWALGMGSTLSKAVYVLVGLAAIYELVMHKGMCKMCGK